MKSTSRIFNAAFSLNGLHFGSINELLEFTIELKKEGADHEVSIASFIQTWFDQEAFVEVETSGSTGIPKRIKLPKSSMVSSARATGAFFKLGEKTTALLCLPPNYIAGKMMVVRAMTLGWQLHVVAPEKDALVQYDNDYDFAAMVPYQVRHSLGSLDKVRKVIIGGGAIPNELEKELQAVSTEVFATYGMTETCSHVAIRRINGPAASEYFAALPNVTFSTDYRDCLVVEANEIDSDEIITNDLVELKSPTSFKWLGRIDNVINSGGIKISPETVEAKLASKITIPFIIASEPDELLGERVILILENKGSDELPNYNEALAELEKYERPRKIYTLSRFPFTDTGKIKRQDVKQILKKYK